MDTSEIAKIVIVFVAILLVLAIVYFFLIRRKKALKVEGVVEKKGTPETKEAIKKETNEDRPLFELKEQSIPSLPNIKDPRKLDVRYALIPPYAYAHIYWDAKNIELVYDIEEPELDAKEKNTLVVLEKGIKELINLSFIRSQDKSVVLIYLEKNIKVLLTELSIKLSMESFLKIMYYIYRDFVGLNEVEPLMNDYFIEDIECNGINTPVYVVHRKYKNIRTNLIYTDIHQMAGFVEKIAQKSGKYVSYAEPLLDGALPDGSRVNATYSKDVSSKGPTYTIRKFTKEPWSPIQLIQKGTVNAEILSYAWMCLEYEHSFMVIGGTGSGKTSFLNALAFFIPPQSRVVTIEDTRELQLEHENWLPSVARAGVGLGNLVGQKYGEVSLFDLLKASFRQRPDYIIVGEIRGKEAYVLFQAFASGHPGCATMHAEDVGTMIRRLETNPINLSGSLVMTLSTVFVMEQTKVGGSNVRKCSSVDEIVNVEENVGNFEGNNVFGWDARKQAFKFNPNSKVFKDIATHFGMSNEQVYREFKYRVQLIKTLYAKRIVGFKEVQKIIHEYYKSPAGVLRRFGIIK
jgi:archaeal flagellar protein FlaI